MRYMYVKDGCVQCRASEAVIDKSMWNVVDVTGDDKAIDRLRKQGYKQFPVIEVFGKYGFLTSWTGFRPDKLKYWEGNSASPVKP